MKRTSKNTAIARSISKMTMTAIVPGSSNAEAIGTPTFSEPDSSR
jgi:hypothetical protein